MQTVPSKNLFLPRGIPTHLKQLSVQIPQAISVYECVIWFMAILEIILHFLDTYYTTPFSSSDEKHIFTRPRKFGVNKQWKEKKNIRAY